MIIIILLIYYFPNIRTLFPSCTYVVCFTSYYIMMTIITFIVMYNVCNMNII